MDRRQLLRGSAAAAFAASCSGLGARRPNLLLIQPDQHRADVLGCAGDPLASTPNVDRLAHEGVRFTRAVSQGPICSPFRATLQTGLHAHTHGVDRNNVRLDPAFDGLARRFRAAGYATGYSGKWHLYGSDPDQRPGGFIPPGPDRFGWDEWHAYDRGHEHVVAWSVGPEGRTRVPDVDWEPAWQTDLALEFMARHEADERPWIHYVSFGPPHAPEVCPQEYLSEIDPAAFPLPPTFASVATPEREAELRRILRVYYGQVAAIDAEVGRLVRGVDELGAGERTLVVYLSDHGDRLGAHAAAERKLRGKGRPVQSAFRIPWILRRPGALPSGTLCDVLAGSVDLAPTLLELCGLDAPAEMQGRSLAGHARGGAAPAVDALHLGLGGGKAQRWWRAVWDGRYLFSSGSASLLFDHAEDPGETRNLLDDPGPAERDLAKRMRARLLEVAEAAGDPRLDELRGA